MKTAKLSARLIMVWITISTVASFAQKPPDVAMNEMVIRKYYSAYEKKDWHMLELILADGYTFSSPAGDDHINLKQYRDRIWPNAFNTRKFDLEKVIVAGDDVYVTYNGWTIDGRLFRNTERFRLKEGRIIDQECFFGPGVSFPNNETKK